MAQRPVGASRSLLVIVIAIITAIAAYSCYYVLNLPEIQEQPIIATNKTVPVKIAVNGTHHCMMDCDGDIDTGHISGIIKGPLIVNITELP